MDLLANPVPPQFADHYARIVMLDSMRRQLIHTAGQIAQLAWEADRTDAVSVHREAMAALARLAPASDPAEIAATRISRPGEW